MQVLPLRIPGAFQVLFDPKQDERGYFLRAFDESIFRTHGMTTEWVQENEAFSRHKGTVRGLHFQRPPYAETKFVRAVRGAVLDVFVDIRRSSPAYGECVTVELSAQAHNAVYIPKGCAHGYCTLTDDSIVLYKVDARYTPEAEGGVLWKDSALSIPWPVTDPVVSAKDANFPGWKDFHSPFD